MTAPLLWNNLLAYSAQVLALVAIGGLLPYLLRVHQPRTQLAYYRLLLAGCLLLPLLQPWRTPALVITRPAITIAARTPPANPSPVSPRFPWEETVLMALGAGAALRALWLLAGLWRLRRLRAGSTPLDPLPSAAEAARLRTGTYAVVAISEAVSSPVTFGARRPIILLPPSFAEQPGETQFGIACHEFLHVRRHDWLLTVCEEFAAALVWFHPAVWWLLGQIRLSREQVVDREVVAMAEDREPYIQALLALGGARPQFDLAPATLFLRKRHLARRVHSLLKEVTMSKARLVACYILSAAALAATAWVVIASFPLQASPRVEVQQSGSGLPRDLVTVEVAGFAEPTLSTMRNRLAEFEGRPYALELRAEILRAAKEVDPAATLPVMTQIEMPNGSLLTRFVVTNRPMYTSGYVAGALSKLAARVGGTEGQREPQVLPSPSGSRIRVGAAEQAAKLVDQAKPIYPPLARQARIQGTVRFTAIIGQDGHVRNLTLVSGHPLLIPAAQEAVRQWVYQPTYLNGMPVEVETQIDLNFTLM